MLSIDIPHHLASPPASNHYLLYLLPSTHSKAKLQMQTSDPRTKLFTGPIDCAQKIIKNGGITQLYRALPATLIFRTSFGVMFSSYHVFNNIFRDFSNQHSQSPFALNAALAQFLAGGLAAELFWLVGYPLDVVKKSDQVIFFSPATDQPI